MRNLEEIARECFAITEALCIPAAIGTPVKYNSRIRKKWGYCRKKSDGTFEISVATVLGEEDTPKKTLMAVILHEMLHTCPGCFNHGKQWKAYAKQITQMHSIKIRATSDAENIGVESRYYIKCRRCEIKAWYPMRPANREQRCPVCGSRKLSCFYKKGDVKMRMWKRN